jgi:hypothetical protein
MVELRGVRVGGCCIWTIIVCACCIGLLPQSHLRLRGYAAVALRHLLHLLRAAVALVLCVAPAVYATCCIYGCHVVSCRDLLHLRLVRFACCVDLATNVAMLCAVEKVTECDWALRQPGRRWRVRGRYLSCRWALTRSSPAATGKNRRCRLWIFVVLLQTACCMSAAQGIRPLHAKPARCRPLWPP